ncbi:hypothetical protein [Paenibacillus pseudetheri]|uniref:hypothetical protein n=1 Tax=Paenibacillus pseudetheri TaxID=2897682 RepID=UPI001F243FDA|nr:hypothetical protein [Paenibacillus pseudetheri]
MEMCALQGTGVVPASVLPRYTVEPDLSICLQPDEKKLMERLGLAERRKGEYGLRGRGSG